MTRLKKALWQNITSLVETLEEAGMSAEDAEGLTADNPLLMQFVGDVKRQRRERERLERAELTPPVEAAPGSPVTLEQAFFPRGRFAYTDQGKSKRARVVNTLDRALRHRLRDDDAVYITDMRHLSREGVKNQRNIGDTSLEFIELTMSVWHVQFADPDDPEMVPTGGSPLSPRLYFSRSEILDVEIGRLGLSLGHESDADSTTLGQYLRMEVSARYDVCDEYTQHKLDEFVERYGLTAQ